MPVLVSVKPMTLTPLIVIVTLACPEPISVLTPLIRNGLGDGKTNDSDPIDFFILVIPFTIFQILSYDKHMNP